MRSVKASKRKLLGENASSKARKVKKMDTKEMMEMDIVVDEEEVNNVMVELKEKEKGVTKEIVGTSFGKIILFLFRF